MIHTIRDREDGRVIAAIEAPTIAKAVERAAGRGVSLAGADLRGRDLRGAFLAGADLRRADLRDADLRGCYLRGADLRDAELGGADMQMTIMPATPIFDSMGDAEGRPAVAAASPDEQGREIDRLRAELASARETIRMTATEAERRLSAENGRLLDHIRSFIVLWRGLRGLPGGARPEVVERMGRDLDDVAALLGDDLGVRDARWCVSAAMLDSTIGRDAQ